MTVLVAHCRAGFEPEASADVRRLADSANVGIKIEAPSGQGYIVGRFDGFDLSAWAAAFERSPPIFVRSAFFGTGPHALLADGATRGRPDRIAPLRDLFATIGTTFPNAGSARGSAGFGSLRLETPDTNDGKELSGLTRSLGPRLETALREGGLMAAASPERAAPARANLHALFIDGAHVYVGASFAPWASPWTMGIPRLRMPGGAPSRSTLKLAEAFVTFLGERESDLLSAGMRAVDLGAAPGGWTWQLARRGLTVTAVDNGPLKGDVQDDPLVAHLRADGLAYLPKRPVDWMVCDIVEQPSRIATLVARWIGEGHARHAIFNLKLPMKKRYDEVRRCEAIIRESLARTRAQHALELRQLYHDREEVTGCVTQSASRRR